MRSNRLITRFAEIRCLPHYRKRRRGDAGAAGTCPSGRPPTAAPGKGSQPGGSGCRRLVPPPAAGGGLCTPSKTSPPTGNRSRTSSFTDQSDEGTLTPDKEYIFPDKQEKQRIPHRTCQVMLEECYHALKYSGHT